MNIECDRSQLEDLREALTIGLVALGEVERLQRMQELSGIDLPGKLRARHPTEAGESTLVFAEALRLVDLMLWVDDREAMS